MTSSSNPGTASEPNAPGSEAAGGTQPELSGQPPRRAAWYRYTDAASIGIEIAVAVTIGAVGGYWLERNVTHWSPWTTLLGIAAGLGAAVKAVLRTARNYKRELRRDAEAAASRPEETQTGGRDQA